MLETTMNIPEPSVARLPDLVVDFLAQTFIRYARTKEPTLVVRPNGPVMFYRWWLMRDEKLCSVYLNRHVGSDDVQAPHDHPWDNMSIILEGEFSEKLYEEHELRATVVRTKGDVVVRTATLSHRIEMRPGEECWTLFITGPSVNKWSFNCPDGPVPAELFLHPLNPLTEPGPGCGGNKPG
jgi:hypothetical protein